MNALVFLDVDGVLNAHEYDPEILCGQIHRDKVARLNRILKATDARIVLSSAWRYIVHRGEANLMGMEWLFRSHGMLAGRLVGITREDTMIRPPFGGHPQSWPHTNERGNQIADWFASNPRFRFSGYVVIDDMDLGISEAGHPFVQTDGTIGLTDEDADLAIEQIRMQAAMTNRESSSGQPGASDAPPSVMANLVATPDGRLVPGPWMAGGKEEGR